MPDAFAEWTALLIRFEADLDPATRVADPWTAPTSPIPAQLEEWARGIADRQREAIAHVEHEKAQAQQHLNALRQVPPVRGTEAVYLDVDG
ncbi:hypothetical protein [Paramicrobacterium fandaimingii]|uniref:hypothetical protein n=1 Tax=Paramicrobacterium fandaimingii TaxID=2708079 RepID=UPI0014215611|nr:hypothetical protein [Microbacterium fandaimingii]